MRNTTLLLSALLTFAGAATASAQVASLANLAIESYGEAVTSTDAFDGNTWYLYHMAPNSSRSGYAYYNASPASGCSEFYNSETFPATGSIAANPDVCNFLFKVIPSTTTDGCFNLLCGNGKYMMMTSGSKINGSENPYDIRLELIAGCTTDFYGQGVDNSIIFDTNGNGSDLAGWGTAAPTTNTGNNVIQFIPVNLTESQAVEVTFNVQIGGRDYATVTQTYNSGNALAAIAAPDYTAIAEDAYTPALGTVITEPTTVTVAATEALPFQTSTAADAEDAKWYYIDMRSTAADYTWTYTAGEEDNVQLPVVAKSQATAPTDEQLWCLTGNLVDGFSIYNKAAGPTMPLCKEATGYSPAVLSAEGTVNKFKLVKSTAIEDAHCFLSIGNDDTYYVNTRSVDGTMVLRGWDATDEGSSCRFFPAMQFMLNYADDITVIPAGALGGFTEASLEAVAEAAAVAGEDPFNTTTGAALATALANLETVEATITDGGYYRVINAQPTLNGEKGLLYIEGESNIRWGTVGKNTINGIFQIYAADDSYIIKNCTAGKYFQGVRGALGGVPTPTTNGKFKLTDLGGAQYGLIFGNGQLHAQNWQYGYETSTLIAWDGTKDTPSAWYIVPVNDIQLALTAIGEASYATTCLPFPISACQGAVMYTASSVTADALVMNAQTAIPAETGVVLYSETADTAAILTLGGEATLSGDNLLSGSLLTVADASPYLLLGTDEATGAVGFYAPTATSISANSAYLDATLVPEGGVALSFEGTTAIETVLAGTGNAVAPVYDLSGRAVNKTVKGHLYIQSGKKFIAR